MKPLIGLRFVHARMVCEDVLATGGSKPAICEVIRIDQDVVWYSVLGGNGASVSREWCEISRFPEICAAAA